VAVSRPCVGLLAVALASVLSWFLNLVIKCDIILVHVIWYKYVTDYRVIQKAHNPVCTNFDLVRLKLYKTACVATLSACFQIENSDFKITLTQTYSYLCVCLFVCLLQSHHELLARVNACLCVVAQYISNWYVSVQTAFWGKCADLPVPDLQFNN
jgi:hypothetical protein